MRPHRGRPEVALVTAGGSRNVRLWLCRPPIMNNAKWAVGTRFVSGQPYAMKAPAIRASGRPSKRRLHGLASQKPSLLVGVLPTDHGRRRRIAADRRGCCRHGSERASCNGPAGRSRPPAGTAGPDRAAAIARSPRLILRFTFSIDDLADVRDVSTAEVSAGPMHPASSDALFG